MLGFVVRDQLIPSFSPRLRVDNAREHSHGILFVEIVCNDFGGAFRGFHQSQALNPARFDDVFFGGHVSIPCWLLGPEPLGG